MPRTAASPRVDGARTRRTHTPHQRLAPTNAVADLLRDAKLDIPWFAEGEAPKKQGQHARLAKRIFAADGAEEGGRVAERVEEVRARARTAPTPPLCAGMLHGRRRQGGLCARRRPLGEANERTLTDEPCACWWLAGFGRTDGGRVPPKGMKVALFEQASSYAPYGGPIQIRGTRCGPSSASILKYMRIWSRRDVHGGSGLGPENRLQAGQQARRIIRQGRLARALRHVGAGAEAELPPTVVVDRPVIQQIFVKHGFRRTRCASSLASSIMKIGAAASR